MESLESKKSEEREDHYLTFIHPMVEIVTYLADNHPDAIEAFGEHEIWHLEEMPLDQSQQEKEVLAAALGALKNLRDIADLIPKDSPDRGKLIKQCEKEYAKALYGLN